MLLKRRIVLQRSIKQLKNGRVSKIFLFTNDLIDINSNLGPNGSGVFNDIEYKNIKDKNIELVVINKEIYMDDTIDEIKKKILLNTE